MSSRLDSILNDIKQYADDAYDDGWAGGYDEGWDAFGENHTDPLDRNQTHPTCLLYTSPRPRDRQKSRMPSSA